MRLRALGLVASLLSACSSATAPIPAAKSPASEAAAAAPVAGASPTSSGIRELPELTKQFEAERVASANFERDIMPPEVLAHLGIHQERARGQAFHQHTAIE